MLALAMQNYTLVEWLLSQNSHRSYINSITLIPALLNLLWTLEKLWRMCRALCLDFLCCCLFIHALHSGKRTPLGIHSHSKNYLWCLDNSLSVKFYNIILCQYFGDQWKMFQWRHRLQHKNVLLHNVILIHCYVRTCIWHSCSVINNSIVN